jgi:hypothetical protein
MPQLNFYVPKETAQKLRERARREGLSLSQYIAKVVVKETGSGWPPGFFEEVLGSWDGDFERPSQAPWTERDSF